MSTTESTTLRARHDGSPETAPEAAPPESGEGLPSGPPPLDEQVVEALETVYDPEIPVNIYELGLIYNVAVDESGHCNVVMTLTSPACPVAGTLPEEVRQKALGVPGVETCDVDVVWDPVWNPSMMSEAARLELGML
ncbi:MAG: DUF59 domain-containing protein [Holophagales bacterium]|nr:DUF59 domain-containing protein [Holophagales bacterium]